ncbi:hypothetical protein K501DRAFT_329636 [Backusella circina FSU 941]|nr:hypothetical protein K501DRAFT_329636 [Backusella circina FSU 941]
MNVIIDYILAERQEYLFESDILIHKKRRVLNASLMYFQNTLYQHDCLRSAPHYFPEKYINQSFVTQWQFPTCFKPKSTILDVHLVKTYPTFITFSSIMVTTRSQGLQIKEEPGIAESKQMLLLNHNSDTETKISTDRKIQTTHGYSNAKSITHEQIKRLLNYLLEHKMSILAASKKAGMSTTTAKEYYNIYMDDPERKVPLPRGIHREKSFYTEKEIKALISCIVDKKMTLTTAARILNMGVCTAAKFYQRYLNDPTKKNFTQRCVQVYTQPQINSVIHYIVKDKMSILAASKKAKMSYSSATSYYKYFLKKKTVPKPRFSNLRRWKKRLDFDQVKKLISYIVDDEMSIEQASLNLNVTAQTGKRYYTKYMENKEIPVPGKRVRPHLNSCTYDQVKNLINYIEEDNMSLRDAAAKADMTRETANKYYSQYLLDPNHQVPIPMANMGQRNGQCISDEQVKELFTYIFIDKLSIIIAAHKTKLSRDTAYNYYSRFLDDMDQKNCPNQDSNYNTIANLTPQERVRKLFEFINVDNMSVASAARKAQMSERTARRYYKQQQEHPDREVTVFSRNVYTYEQVKELIRIVDTEKITIKNAAKRINMTSKAAQVYYRKYREDPLHQIPVPAMSKYELRQKVYQTHFQIILDIYNKGQEIAKKHSYYNLDDSITDSIPLEPVRKCKPKVTRACR